MVRIGNLLRFVLPIGYFIETPFRDRARTTARVIGTAFVYTECPVPLGAVRAEVGRLVEGSEHFDGDTWRVHVTALHEGSDSTRSLRR